jgi:DNA-directed RNA polymerase subunit E'/Rpb7
MVFVSKSISVSYKSQEENVTLKAHDQIRFKIVGVRNEATNIFAIESLVGNFLGPIKN